MAKKREKRISYRLRPGFRTRVPVEVAAPAIEAHKKRNGDEVKVQELVDESKPVDAPLHPEFTWDDRIAANLHRLNEARYVVRSYEIVETDNDGREEAHIANVCVTNEEDERVYVSSARAMTDAELRAQVIADAEALLFGIVGRYRGIPGLGGLLHEAIRRLNIED
jgi:hypothetical protein